MSVDELIENYTVSLTQGVGLLDIRQQDAFRARHLFGATSMPAESIAERWHELPPKGSSLMLYGSEPELSRTVRLLYRHGYQITATLEHDRAASHPDLTDQYVHNHSSRRLWRACPLLEQHCEIIERQLPEGMPRRALDLACGAGRESIYLCLRRWQVTAVDNMASALEKVNAFAGFNDCTIDTLLLDLETDPDWPAKLPCREYSLVTMNRYLHRPLLPRLPALLPVGGILAIQTFMEGAELFGKPKNPDHLLAPGELRKIFSTLEIIEDEVAKLPDGRPVSSFIAQKTA